MMTHTPGPWYVTGPNIHAEYKTADGDRINRWIATISAGQGDEPRLTDYANARLIAAAPELRAALEDAVRTIERIDAERFKGCAWLAPWKALLARIEL